MFWRRRRPDAPSGVRAYYADGTTTDPLPLARVGIDPDGIDVWEAMLPDARRPAGLRIDYLPAQCGVEVYVPRGD